MKIVGKIIRMPPKPVTKPIPGLSKHNDVSNNEIVNVGMAQNKNFLSLLKNGNAIKKIAKGIKKN